MDYGRSSESNAITITPDPNSQEIWMAGLNDQALWATEEDYRNWNGRDLSPDPSSNYDARPSQSRSGSEQPPSKKPRNSPGDTAQGNGSGSKSRVLGKMFFKTKMCCKFRAGTCPYITNCNFAHGIEELRKPPPNWQEIVAAQDEGPELREEHQIPILSSSAMSGDSQRSYKGRHCKKFYTDEGCPYGDMCTFLHDEQSKARESVAISLGPTLGSGNYGNGAAGVTQKPSNWKTRICNKWEITGYCPFGSKCHFAHGSTELHRYGGGLVDGEGRDCSSAALDQKQMGTSASKAASDNLITVGASVPHSDIYHIGAPSQRVIGVNQRQSQRPLQRWKGPDKISRIYGDWINDDE